MKAKNEYEQQAIDFMKKTKTTFSAKFVKRDFYFHNDKEKRDIYKITLRKDGKQYSFRFGQSIANVGIEPTPYNVFACLTKYDPESFEDFCSNYGYDEDSRQAEKIYKAVVEEYNSLCRLYSDEELDLMAEIS